MVNERHEFECLIGSIRKAYKPDWFVPKMNNSNIEFSKLWFVSFADSRYAYQLKRIHRQALRFGFREDHIFTCTEDDLDKAFRLKMRDILVIGSRGYGYWCWKPQIILQALEKMPKGDVLLYTDAGCYLNKKGMSRFSKYLEMAQEQGILGFQSRFGRNDVDENSIHKLLEKYWTKGDVFDWFGVREDSHITHTGQYWAGMMLVSKRTESVEFFKRFRQIFLDNLNLVTDQPSVSPNFPGFIENRHDQSIFSLLYKINNYKSLSSAEAMPPWTKYNPANEVHVILGRDFFKHPENRPIYALRNLST